ncbi:MAG: LLM class F420-dependent oxidoreductase [Chloroflexota bacterium]|nr:LLM class F420-dependent oxidoreductase [Chloroflexota bacterium]MDQ5864492.1 LLM class F420-dependent oxidoreductase [Chloroflexota bacterium]
MPSKFGVLVPQGWRLDLVDIADPVEKYEHMTRFGQEAERLGYDSIWVYDHFHTVPTQELETNFECWISTAGLARDTSTIRIGQMVTCNNYRNPALLAKMASTVDVLSHGRLDFGIGAGWYVEEYNAYGYPFPDGPERLRMLGEALQIFHAMWKDDYATFEGKYYQIKGAINEPKGVQQPHMPIWVGGSGEKVTLKLVAKYGDACNITAMTPEDYRRKFDILRGHCDNVSRDYNSIIKSAHVFMTLLEPGQDPEAATERWRRGASLEEYKTRNFVGTPEETVEYFRSIEEAGVEYFVIYFRNDLTRFDTIQTFAEEVMRQFR